MSVMPGVPDGELAAHQRELRRAVAATEHPGAGPDGAARFEAARQRVHVLTDRIEEMLGPTPS